MEYTRIIDDTPAQTYPSNWIAENSGKIINGALVSEWVLAPKYTGNFVKPKWNGTEYYESATPEYISSLQIVNETNLYLKRANDGRDAYAAISAEFRVAKLNGIITEEAHAVIERTLIPVRNEVLAGQWISALNELEIIGSVVIGLELYDRLHLQISNYIFENYVLE